MRLCKMAREGLLTEAPERCRLLVIRMAEYAIELESEERIVAAAIVSFSGIGTENSAKALMDLRQGLVKLHHPEFEADTDQERIERIRRQLDEVPEEMSVVRMPGTVKEIPRQLR